MNIGMLKKISAGLKVASAVVSFAIIWKYESVSGKGNKYISYNKTRKYDWD